MKTLLRTVGASLLAMAVVAAQSRPTLPTGTARVAGVVVDQAGAPVAGANVNVRGEKNEEGPRITTGTDGRFLFDALPAAPIRIEISKVGSGGGAYGRKRRNGTGLPLTPGTEGTEDIRIVLWPIGAGVATITGRVIDERGNPIANVPVRALPRSTPAASAPATPPTVQTNDGGVYAMSLPEGTYILQALISGTHVPAPRGVPMSRPSSGPQIADIAFLTDPDGAFVYFPRLLPPPPDRDNHPRAYVASFLGGATLETATPITLSRGDTRTAADLTLRAVRGVRLGGVVTGPRGLVEGAMIRLSSKYEDLPIWGGTETASSGKDGRFEFVLVATGPYVLDGAQRLPPLETHLDSRGFPVMGMNDYNGSDNDSLWLRQAIDVTADRTDLALTLTPGTRLTARIVAENGASIAPAALQNASVRLEAVRQGVDLGSAGARVLEPGRYAIQARPGSYFVRAGAPRGLVVSSVIKGSEDITDRLITVGIEAMVDDIVVAVSEPARLTGTVVDGAGRPPADASVVIFPADRLSWGTTVQTSTRFRNSRTTTGQFTFDNLPPGAYLLVAVDDAMLDEWPEGKIFERLAALAIRVTIVVGSNTAPTLTLR